MKNMNIVATAAACALLAGGTVHAQTASMPASSDAAASEAPACAAETLSSDSTVGELLDNPAAKAILIKRVPELKDNDQIDQARPMTLRSLQAYAADTFTDKVLADIDTDLAALPACGK
ncbi:hypothetical protein [Asticcacaulis taihuensis]|uniref:Uncharacterized protein n=1 Tax=Asticcacaulis taihuensis TaxID=260084 RepID=A0A1G4T3F5_9CAUL|nr:hypothetical protein [Asticcacaulis taihuensis]SCW75964.1 hypothetical protein SAMN02927928_3225 [Asticcacaulis taihuensis]